MVPTVRTGIPSISWKISCWSARAPSIPGPRGARRGRSSSGLHAPSMARRASPMSAHAGKSSLTVTGAGGHDVE